MLAHARLSGATEREPSEPSESARCVSAEGCANPIREGAYWWVVACKSNEATGGMQPALTAIADTIIPRNRL